MKMGRAVRKTIRVGSYPLQRPAGIRALLSQGEDPGISSCDTSRRGCGRSIANGRDTKTVGGGRTSNPRDRYSSGGGDGGRNNARSLWRCLDHRHASP